jgi:hypothetical protein
MNTQIIPAGNYRPNTGGWKRLCLIRLPTSNDGQDSAVGSDSLRTGRSADRIPVVARFSALVQTDPGAHPASCTMGTVSFPGVKGQRLGVDHPPQSTAEVKEGLELYLYSPCGPSWPVLG